MADSGFNPATGSPAARKGINFTPTSKISLGPSTSVSLSRLPGSFVSRRAVPRVPNLLSKNPHFGQQVQNKNPSLPSSKGKKIVIQPFAVPKLTRTIKKPSQAYSTPRAPNHTPSTSKLKGSKAQAYLQ